MPMLLREYSVRGRLLPKLTATIELVESMLLRCGCRAIRLNLTADSISGIFQTENTSSL